MRIFYFEKLITLLQIEVQSKVWIQELKLTQRMPPKSKKKKIENTDNCWSYIMKHKSFYEHRVFVNSGDINEFCLIMSWKWDDKHGMSNVEFKPTNDSMDLRKNYKNLKAHFKWECQTSSHCCNEIHEMMISGKR